MIENALDKCYNKDALRGRGKTILFKEEIK